MASRSKRTAESKQTICKYLKVGSTRQCAADMAGLSLRSLHSWMQADPSMRDAVLQAEGEAQTRCEALIMAAAPKSWQAAAWWLERRRSHAYSTRQVIAHEFDELSDQELIERAKGVIAEVDAGVSDA